MDFSILSKIISLSVLVSNVLFVLFLFLYFTNRGFKTIIKEFIKNNILFILIVPILASILGSLMYSEILGFKPCVLCWYQRIIIYPQFILLAVAIKNKYKDIVDYLIPFNVIGFLISFYQTYSNWTGTSLLPCTASGGECSRIYVLDFGYITIPFMALSVFVYMLVVSFIYKTDK